MRHPYSPNDDPRPLAWWEVAACLLVVVLLAAAGGTLDGWGR